jgi:hypothetical protein
MTRIKRFCGFSVLVILVGGCANQPVSSSADTPGFVSGLWHGAVALFALIGSIFTDARIYSFPNSGVSYDFGFIVGLSIVLIYLITQAGMLIIGRMENLGVVLSIGFILFVCFVALLFIYVLITGTLPFCSHVDVGILSGIECSPN